MTGTTETKREGRLVQWSPWLWTAALVVLFHAVVTVEWVHPYCNDPSDGPAYSGWGFPLPYQQFGGVSSEEYVVMLHVYVLDCLLVGLPLFFLVRPLARKVARLRWVARAVSAVCLALVVLDLGFTGLAIHEGFWRPVLDIADGRLSRYVDYRPLLVSAPHYDCPPSEFWFGPPRRHAAPGE